MPSHWQASSPWHRWEQLNLEQKMPRCGSSGANAGLIYTTLVTYSSISVGFREEDLLSPCVTDETAPRGRSDLFRSSSDVHRALVLDLS